LVERERCAYLRPVIAQCETPDAAISRREFMFPFSSVVRCPENQMLAKIGPTLVATVITRNPALIRAAGDAPQIDRLNVGPIPTTHVDWRQPHEGNIIEFLYRARACQVAEECSTPATPSPAC
jgi:acyl-CoA reductase-like NAD-dependent aldehyde dehydrogenase